MKKPLVLIGVALLCGACSRAVSHPSSSEPSDDGAAAEASEDIAPPPADPGTADQTLGERLFLETRFAQFFAQSLGSSAGAADYNRALTSGDPVLDTSVSIFEDYPGPFAGKSMNCRACHLVDDLQQMPAPTGRNYSDFFAAGVRNYSDFARRSPIPARPDGAAITPRNSPTLVDATVARDDFVLHLDGEFATTADLIRATFTGRNYGWLPTEEAAAIRHFAAVIRNDDGSDQLAADQSAGLSYAVMLKGTDPRIPAELRIAPGHRIDVADPSVTDAQVLDAATALVVEYLDGLRFTFTSPYDVFLKKNNLPAQPNTGEAPLDYARRLRTAVANLSNPQWVTSADGAFQIQVQSFQFGKKQLDGLELFLSEKNAPAATNRVGNCVACHAPPEFTDFSFHNVGATQDEFDELFGDGAFAALVIPSLTQRNQTPDQYLPASAKQPNGLGPFRSPPESNRTDLGLWNVFANDAIPGPQAALRRLLGASSPPTDADLAKTVALFKTPTLRDLGQSAPYFHTGQLDSLESVIQHYVRFSGLARAGKVRNGAAELQDMTITGGDVESLRAFLRALNEDYH